MVAGTLTVVQMLPELQSGGVERGTLEMGAFLSQKGHRSIVISRGGQLVSQLEKNGSIHLDWKVGGKSPMTLQYFFPLRRLLTREKVDILHLRSRVPAWLGYLVWKSLPSNKRPRLVTTVHGDYSTNFFSGIMTKGERVIAVSKYIQQYIINNYPKTARKKISIIPRGIDPQAYPYGYMPSEHWLADWYARYPQLRVPYVLGIIGRISRLKGHLFFLEVIKGLLLQGIDVHGLIVGRADDKNSRVLKELYQFVEQNQMDRQITFAGYHEQVKDIMSSLDMVVSFSKKPESFGRSVLEALSLGIPVAGFAYGGVGEILRKIFPAGLIREHDMENALEVITRIRNKRSLPLKEHPFTLDRMLSNTLRLYHELISNHERAETPLLSALSGK
jgi:glycosyltransferase involved in cell wall biosynthesis